MPRSIWNGTIAFGMVSVPIKLYSATSSKTVRFHQVHERDGSRIAHRRVCPVEDEEVPREEVVKGYEVAEDEYVVLDREEVKAAAGDRGKVVRIEEFVDANAIDPVFYEKTYYVGCREDEEAYALLHAALRRTERAGIGRFSFHNREYLAAVRAFDDSVLALHTMRFHDEVVDVGALEIPEPGRAPTTREIEMARRLVDSLREDFRPEAYEDTYREAVLELIDRKAAGEEVETEVSAEEPEPADDLVAALEASLEKAA